MEFEGNQCYWQNRRSLILSMESVAFLILKRSLTDSLACVQVTLDHICNCMAAHGMKSSQHLVQCFVLTYFVGG